MLNPLNPYARHYASLSIKDLLDAREAYHVHLMQMENVFATAIGLYRIQSGDMDYHQYAPAGEAAHADRGKRAEGRTMENSIVKPWSWPCVLVFVKHWYTHAELRIAGMHNQVVPPFLYLPDGRVIPVCVVQASLWEGSDPQLVGYQFSSGTIGGGYPVYTEVQGAAHVGSVACLVTDGARHYALTNQHVAGDGGNEIFTLLQGDGRRVGFSAQRSLRSLPFEQLYPGFPGATTRGNLDIGLIDVNDLSEWTAQVYGLGVLGPVAEFNVHTASLDWIGTAAVAHGAHSGDLKGEIKALFYRYRTMGGVDFVSDFLIGGIGAEPMRTMPGDSGTLWCIETPLNPPANSAAPAAKKTKRDAETKAKHLGVAYRPFAVEWGGQKLSNSGGVQYTQYALASSVAVVCRELEVEIVIDLNAEMTQYWGAVGHYKIAERAVNATSGPLKAFLTANLAQLTYPASVISGGKIKPSPLEFVPLADVPDVVWKSNINRGGAAVRPQENWNHYADMDLPGGDGQTLFDLSGVVSNAKPLTATTLKLSEWLDFYHNAPQPSASTSKKSGVNMGDLPFRVWQIFDAMVAATTQDEFLCAAGVLGHYVGDACQPLHSSMHADGLNGASTGVHGAYEETMVDKHAKAIATQLNGTVQLEPVAKGVAEIVSGRAAGLAVIELMARAHRYLPPEKICDTYNSLGGGKGAAVIQGLWEAHGQATVQCMADGARTLGQLWQAAYGLNPLGDFSGVVSQTVLKKIYENKIKFVPSLHLANLDPADYPDV